MMGAGDGPVRVDLDLADRDLLVSRVIAVARRTPQDPPPGRRLWAGAAGGLALVATIALLGGLLSARPPGPTAEEASAAAPASAAGPAASPSVPVPTAAPSASTMTWNVGGRSVVTPAGWHLAMAHRWTMPVGPMAFLSNAPVVDPCSTELLPGSACWKPLLALPAGGVLVTFSGSAVLTPSDLWGKVSTGAADAICSSLGGETQMGAAFGGFVVRACLRGPDVSAGEDVFRQIVASLLASTSSR